MKKNCSSNNQQATQQNVWNSTIETQTTVESGWCAEKLGVSSLDELTVSKKEFFSGKGFRDKKKKKRGK